jgi:hypothetical protein
MVSKSRQGRRFVNFDCVFMLAIPMDMAQAKVHITSEKSAQKDVCRRSVGRSIAPARTDLL